MITQEYLKSVLHYNEITGVFTWKVSNSKKLKVGSIAGWYNTRGYVQITIKNKKYTAHRLAWLYMYGTDPKAQIDHVNGNKEDNRIDNLREVNNRENNQNKTVHRNGRLVGYSLHKNTKKYQARVNVNKKVIHIGLYNTPQEAHEAYVKKLKELGL